MNGLRGTHTAAGTQQQILIGHTYTSTTDAVIVMICDDVVRQCNQLFAVLAKTTMSVIAASE